MMSKCTVENQTEN